jgi:hypothetical protein
MRIFLIIALLIFSFPISCSNETNSGKAPVESAEDPLETTTSNIQAESAVDSLVALLLDGHAVEHREARKFHYPEKMQGSFFVFFTIKGLGGGDDYTSYLALFAEAFETGGNKETAARKTGKYRLVGYAAVGGKGWREVDFDHLSTDQNITLWTKAYGKAGSATYKVEHGQLVEVNAGSLLTVSEIVNEGIPESESQPFAVMAKGVILTARTERGMVRAYFRYIPPKVCISGKTYSVYTSTKLPWDSKYFIPELFKDESFAEVMVPVYLAECPSVGGTSFEPEKTEIESLVKESFSRAVTLTDDYRSKCKSPIAKAAPDKDVSVQSNVAAAGNQAVLDICTNIPVCAELPRFAVSEKWILSKNMETVLMEQSAVYPSGEIYYGGDAGCDRIGGAYDFDSDGNMELIVHDHGAESWGLSIQEYEDGKFVKRAQADDGL